MHNAEEPDYYEILQVSPRADRDMVDRVFRHLAKRYHPDSPGGDTDLFEQVVEAYRVISDAEKRAEYDAHYQDMREEHWRIFDSETTGDHLAEDRRIRQAILAALYAARRHDVDRPGVGSLELERLVGCPQEHMKFHMWYLKENGWAERTQNGLFAITAAGVDKAMDTGTPWQNPERRQLSAEGGGGSGAGVDE
jgi:curved DNA-binding protein CbpA